MELNTMSRVIAAVVCAWLLSPVSAQQATPPKSRSTPLTLDELISDPDLQDAAVSPSGRYVAVALWRRDSDLVALMDLDTRQTKVLTTIGHDVAGKNLNVRI